MYVSENRKKFNYRKNVLPTKTRILVTHIAERESTFGRLAMDHLGHEGFAVRTLSIETALHEFHGTTLARVPSASSFQ